MTKKKRITICLSDESYDKLLKIINFINEHSGDGIKFVNKSKAIEILINESSYIGWIW